MGHLKRNVAWLAVFLGLVVFAVPWFLWGDSTVVAGLPAWLWYHIGWLVLTALVFYAFTQRGWGALVGVRSTRRDTAPTTGDRR